MLRVSTTVIAGLFAAACGEVTVDRPDGGYGFLDSRGMTPPPDPPVLDRVPPSTPYTVATIRGTAMARRVVTIGSGNPIATVVLPDQTFCVDAPTPQPGAYEFQLLAQSADGLLSSATTVNVTFDPGAAAIPNAQTCAGGDPAGCPNAHEICGNMRDDDCNNLVDEQDPACATCTDDQLEENDHTSAPRIDPGRYDGLVVCPDDPDYYGIFARAGDEISARAFFSDAMGNIDMQLLGLDHATVLASGDSTTDDEMITYTASTAGEYKLHVYGVRGATNQYALDVKVEM